MNVTLIRGIVRDGKVEVDDRIELPEGTEVDIVPHDDERPSTPEEIARDLALMDAQKPWNIPPEVAEDLEAWERKVNEYSKANLERGLEDAFP